MEIELIALRLDRPLTREERAHLAAFVPPERLRRLEALRDPTRADEPLCAYAALRLALREHCGWQTLPPLAYGAHGKPCFADHPEVCFSLSHTRGAVLVGIHDQPLGVDIERIRPMRARAMQRLADTADEREFFARWTRRESRAKWSGAGLAASREAELPALHGERLEPVETFVGYVACLCTHTADPIAPLRRLTLRDLTEQ